MSLVRKREQTLEQGGEETMAENEEIVTAEQVNAILRNASLGQLASPLEHLTNGWTNITLKFTVQPSGRVFILRQYRPGTLRKISRENIEYELKYLSYLSSALDLPVVPMLDPPGLVTLPNETFVVLFPFLSGMKSLDAPSTPVRQFWQTSSISRFLGRMHSNVVTKNYPLLPSDRSTVNYVEIKYELVNCSELFEQDFPDLYRRTRRIIDEHLGEIPLLSKPAERQQWETNYQADLPIGYIHADIHDDNVLFASDEEKLLAVLDFDDMYVGPLLIDLAMTLCLWCSVGCRFNFAYAREFLRVYQVERQMPLTEKEWSLLEIFCYLTLLNQVLFVAEAEKEEEESRAMIEALLSPLEDIGESEGMFLEKIR